MNNNEIEELFEKIEKLKQEEDKILIEQQDLISKLIEE